MPWDPGTYNMFKNERNAPFYDLLALIDILPGLKVIDLGCGTGELTRILADKLPGANVLGIDSSEEMLAAAVPASQNLSFQHASIEDFISWGQTFDLVFSNAAIHWLDNHKELFPGIINTLNSHGRIAIQIPSNHDHFTHTAIRELARQSPFKEALNGWVGYSSVLPVEDYAAIFFKCGLTEINIFEKVYPHVLKDAEALANWTSGTTLVPYLDKMDINLKNAFLIEYKDILAKKFTGAPVFYPFKRIIMTAKKP